MSDRRQSNPTSNFDRVLIHTMQHNPRGLLQMNYKNGFLEPKNSEELYNNIKEIIAADGESGVRELMTHHPDNKLMMEAAVPQGDWLMGVPEDHGYRGKGLEYGVTGYQSPTRYAQYPTQNWVDGVIAGREDYFGMGMPKDAPNDKNGKVNTLLLFILVLVAVYVLVTGGLKLG